MQLRSIVCLLTVVSWACAMPADSAFAHTPAEAMSQAAESFLASLDPAQREKAAFEFSDQERLNWHFIPKTRAGLSLKEMTPHQQQYALAMLHTALSHRGFSKALNIMALEQILHEMENNSPTRDPQLYHFYIFGKPSLEKTWSWRAEGHHFSLSVTLVDGQKITGTPSFYGANPAHVKQGAHAGLRVLAEEEDLARQLLASLDEDQRAVAIIQTDAPRDVINGPGRKATPLEPLGIAATQLKGKQRRILMKLVREYVFNLRPELARADMAKIREAGVDKIHFAWAGSTNRGEGHYYRVQGPSFILEYDNTQNDANHVHTVWRDFQNDFGEDWLKKHYAEDPHEL